VIDLWSDAGTLGLQARFAYTFTDDHGLMRESMISFALNLANRRDAL